MVSVDSVNTLNLGQGVFSVKYRKSAIGYPRDQKETLRALGFTKLGQVRVFNCPSPSVVGMLNKVRHLIEIQGE